MSRYFPFILLALAWPGLQLLIFFLRFGNLHMSMLIESSVFIPFAALSSLLLFYLLKKSSSSKQRKFVIGGYMLMIPIAFIGSLMGGLIFQPIVGATLYGLIPLAIGMGVGFLLGKTKNASNA